MRKKIMVITLSVFVLVLGFASIAEAGGPLDRASVWVDGELFGTVVTPAVFDPANGPCDDIAESVEDLNLDDFQSTDMYFECPLLPTRG